MKYSDRTSSSRRLFGEAIEAGAYPGGIERAGLRRSQRRSSELRRARCRRSSFRRVGETDARRAASTAIRDNFSRKPNAVASPGARHSGLVSSNDPFLAGYASFILHRCRSLDSGGADYIETPSTHPWRRFTTTSARDKELHRGPSQPGSATQAELLAGGCPYQAGVQGSDLAAH